MKEILGPLLNLPSLEVIEVSLPPNEVHIHCCSTQTAGICPHCLRPTQEITKYYTRKLRDLPIFDRKTYLHIKVRQFHCRDCPRSFSERLPFADSHRTYTKRMEKFIFKCSANIPFKEVAAIVDVSPHKVEEVFTRYSDQALDTKGTFEEVRYLGIDEIAIKKGKKDYACVLVDIERGLVLDFLEDRSKDFLMKYFQNKGKAFCQQIEILSCDMWEGFASLAKEVFPNAITVIDRFHVVRHLGKALEKERKSLRRTYPQQDQFKRLHWILRKQPDSLEQHEIEIRDKAFAQAPDLKRLYELKLEFKQIFDKTDSKQEAELKMEQWNKQAKELNNPHMNRFLKLWEKWKERALNYFPLKITNGVVEGMNKWIRTLIRKAYGYRNFNNLRRRILMAKG